jgi:hypothetical protein
MSAVAARGTVEMLSAPERVKVSTDGPSQPSSLQAMKTGKTPVLEGAEWRKLLASIPATTLRDLRDRALIATLT